MDAFDDDPDLEDEDALLFGDDATPQRGPTLPRRPSALPPRLQEAARLAAESANGLVERTGPLFVEDHVHPASDDVAKHRTERLAEREPSATVRRSASHAELATKPRAWSARSAAAVAALLGLVGVAGAVVLAAGSGGGERVVVGPVPAPVDRVVTQTITVRAPAPPRAAPPTAVRRPSKRRHTPRAQTVTPVAPSRSAVRAPAAVAAPRRVYRAPVRPGSADAAFGVRIP